MVDSESSNSAGCHRAGTRTPTHRFPTSNWCARDNARLTGVRRVHLARVHYHLYYRVTAEPAIEVLALWHTSRGASPEL